MNAKLGLDLMPGQRVAVRFDIQSKYVREYGNVESVVADTGTRMVKLDKVEVALPFAPDEITAIIPGQPHYNPSERCESGMRPGCTCDTCF